MQVIRTRPVKQTQLEYASKVMKGYFRKRWVFAVLLLMVGISQYMLGGPYAKYFLGFAILFPVFMCFFLYFVTGSKHLKWYYAEKALRIDEGGFKMDMADGRKERIKWDQVKKVRRLKSGYELHNDPPLFLYLPFEAFLSDADKAEFERILRDNKKIG